MRDDLLCATEKLRIKNQLLRWSPPIQTDVVAQIKLAYDAKLYRIDLDALAHKILQNVFETS